MSIRFIFEPENQLGIFPSSIGEAQVLEVTEDSLPENLSFHENEDETKPYSPITPAPTFLTTPT